MNTEGISVIGSLVDAGVKYGSIAKSGAFFKIGEENLQGREGAKRYLKENPKVAENLTTGIWDKINQGIVNDSAKDQEE